MDKDFVFDEEDEVMIEQAGEEREPLHGDTVDDSEGGGEYNEDKEDEPDEYEKDGFIVDDVDDEPEEEEKRADSAEEERHKKKKRKKSEEYLLDEDDYELLEDNNVFAPRRKGKFKQLKKSQEEAPAEAEDDGEVGKEDEMEDFIVDEEFDATGVPVRQRKLKRKKSRQAPGVSSSSLHEAHEIFGDVDELLLLRKQGSDSNERRVRRLEDEFEPSVLSEKYMIEKDDQIRELDIPERIQIYEESTGSPPLDGISIDDESTWIYNQLRSGTIPLYSKPGLGSSISRDDIIRFLDLHYVQKLDIPFIAMHRKDECQSLLKDPEHLELEEENQDKIEKLSETKWHKVLWALQDLHRNWLLLQKRKSALQSYYSKRFEVESQQFT